MRSRERVTPHTATGKPPPPGRTDRSPGKAPRGSARGHVGDGASSRLPTRSPYLMRKHGDTKIAEQDLRVVSKQQVLWLDVLVNEIVIVKIVQGSGNLPHIRDNGLRIKSLTPEMIST